MSGETYRPHHSWSSPVFTIIVSSSGGTTRRRPSTNFAPPVPPVKTTIMRRSARSLPDLLSHRVLNPAVRTCSSLDHGIPDKPVDAVAIEILLRSYAVPVAQDVARGARDW